VSGSGDANVPPFRWAGKIASIDVVAATTVTNSGGTPMTTRTAPGWQRKKYFCVLGHAIATGIMA
jgi:hypothetical protein